MSLGKNKRPRSRAAEGLHYQVVPTKKRKHTPTHTVRLSNCHESFGLSSVANHLGNPAASRILGNPDTWLCECESWRARMRLPLQALLFLRLLLLPMLLLLFLLLLRVCKPCYYNNVQSEPVMKHWKKPCEDRSVEKHFTFSIN